MLKNHQLKVAAKALEIPQQFIFLRTYACDEEQGYFVNYQFSFDRFH
jgi:EAL domain-containing protein (putative c-di-GMP-specific phosphodiesterase class I)